MNVAIDGPSGAGKSTVAKALAKKFGFFYLDTGALYRAVGLYFARGKIDSRDKDEIVMRLPEINISFAYIDGDQRVFLNGEDVSEQIRTPLASKYASDVSAVAEVRAALLDIQRGMAEKHDVIMDGRDIGTVILPDARIKIFLTASTKARAERRYSELKEKGQNVSFQEVLHDMEERDKNDSDRAFAPLKAAPDAIIIDTSDLTLEQSIEKMSKLIEEKL